MGEDPRDRMGGLRDRRGGPRGRRGGHGAEGEVPGAEWEVPGTGRKFLADLCWADSKEAGSFLANSFPFHSKFLKDSVPMKLIQLFGVMRLRWLLGSRLSVPGLGAAGALPARSFLHTCWAHLGLSPGLFSSPNPIALLHSQILSNRFVFSLAVPVMVSVSSTCHVAIKS